VSCSGVVRHALWQLPSAYEALLSVSVIRASPTDTVRVSGSKERQSPSGAVDLRDELFQRVRWWEDDLRVFLRLRAAQDAASREVTLRQSVELLSREFGRMMERPGSTGFGQDMTGLLGRVLRAVKNGPTRSLLIYPCAFCNRRCLIQHEGLANRPWFTACEPALGGCGRLFTEQEIEWMAEVRVVIGR
jgi:hypothetical protein